MKYFIWMIWPSCNFLTIISCHMGFPFSTSEMRGIKSGKWWLECNRTNSSEHCDVFWSLGDQCMSWVITKTFNSRKVICIILKRSFRWLDIIFSCLRLIYIWLCVIYSVTLVFFVGSLLFKMMYYYNETSLFKKVTYCFQVILMIFL